MEALAIDNNYLNLTPVTATELEVYRKRRIPSFVLKKDGKLFYTRIPRNVNFMHADILGPHKCANSFFECRCLSAASDEMGGCDKVRNFAKFIERYPFIKVGYETFSTNYDSFIVVECEHYKEYELRHKKPTAEDNKVKIDFYKYHWRTINSL